MRRRTRAALLVAVLALAATGCSSEGGGAMPKTGEPWTGATALTGSEDHAFGVVLDGASVLFATGGSQVGENAIRRVPLDASAASAVVFTNPGGTVPSGVMAVDGDDLYAAVGTTIVRFPKAGGEGTVVVPRRPAGIRSVVVDGDRLWWSTSELNSPDWAEVATAPKDGSGPVEVVGKPADGSGSFSTVVLDGTGGAFAASPNGIVHVRRGQPAEVVVSDDAVKGAVTRVARNGDHLFGAVAGRGLFTVPLAGGAPVELSKQVDDVRDLEPIADGVAYFDDGELRYVPAAGGPSVLVAKGPYAEGSLAASGRTLVFAADWKIWKAELPG